MHNITRALAPFSAVLYFLIIGMVISILIGMDVAGALRRTRQESLPTFRKRTKS